MFKKFSEVTENYILNFIITIKLTNNVLTCKLLHTYTVHIKVKMHLNSQ